MITKKIAIDGEWYEINLFLEDNQDIRIEIHHPIRMKTYRMYPDNKVNVEHFKESKDG